MLENVSIVFFAFSVRSGSIPYTSSPSADLTSRKGILLQQVTMIFGSVFDHVLEFEFRDGGVLRDILVGVDARSYVSTLRENYSLRVVKEELRVGKTLEGSNRMRWENIHGKRRC